MNQKILLEILLFVILTVVLSVLWGMGLEALKPSNPQLSDTVFVRLAPVFLMLTIYAVRRKKR